MARILIVDDQDMMRDSLAQILVREGHEVVAATDGASAAARLGASRFDLLITDLRMPKMTGLELLAEAKRLRPDMPVVLMTAFATVSNAVEAMRLGAYDYIQKPFNGEEIKLLVDRTLEHSRLRLENQAYRSMTEIGAQRPLVGDGPAMEQVRLKIELVSRSNATVLIRGESGTGKEIVARAIHVASARRERPMLAVNCAALSENLLESELFGHEKGAFTGAIARKIGRLELAHEGTLFLDEVGELPLATQVRLLRVLEEREVRPVGSNETRKIDVRLIAATNRNLAAATRTGKFREDLFYRLNVIAIELPPLRSRREDIPALATHFLKYYSEENSLSLRALTPEAIRALVDYDWPGNVRELENVIERGVVLSSGGTIGVDLLPGHITGSSYSSSLLEHSPDASLFDIMEDIERRIIVDKLERCNGNQTDAAEQFRIPLSTLNQKIKRLNIEIRKRNRE